MQSAFVVLLLDALLKRKYAEAANIINRCLQKFFGNDSVIAQKLPLTELLIQS